MVFRSVVGRVYVYLIKRGDRDGRSADLQLRWNHADPAERSLNRETFYR